jgi:hypothetical protein
MVLATVITGHESLRLFPVGLPRRYVPDQPTHCSELKAETEAVTEKSQVTLGETSDNFVVRFQRVHEVEGFHIDLAFT